MFGCWILISILIKIINCIAPSERKRWRNCECANGLHSFARLYYYGMAFAFETAKSISKYAKCHVILIIITSINFRHPKTHTHTRNLCLFPMIVSNTTRSTLTYWLTVHYRNRFLSVQIIYIPYSLRRTILWVAHSTIYSCYSLMIFHTLTRSFFLQFRSHTLLIFTRLPFFPSPSSSLRCVLFECWGSSRSLANFITEFVIFQLPCNHLFQLNIGPLFYYANI